MTEKKKKENSLNDNLKRLAEISNWFADQQEIDLDAGLDMVKEAAALIKKSREQLNAVENEFKEIEKEFAPDRGEDNLKDSLPM